ncbi:MAG: PriCT-2 domain-containing protein [Lysobacter sp.]
MPAGRPIKSVLRKYGTQLLENGYSILPIPAGRKGPIEPQWQKIKADEKLIRKWSSGDYKNGSIGFHTKYTPAVDIDITDEEMSGLMASHVRAIVGDTMTRVGRAPKTMLIYRTTIPFQKRKVIFVDLDGHDQAIEVLGDGQQFVGIGIHPDTKKPYRWTSGKEMTPLSVPADFLPEITQDHIDEIMSVFKLEAGRRGWTLKRHNAASESRAMTSDDANDNALLEHKRPLENLTVDQLRDVLEWVPGNDDYESWLKVGMALHHQFDGEEDGLQLWHEWSESAHNYDDEALERKWNSFHDEMGRNVTTAATLIKLAKEHKQEHSKEQFDKIQRKVKESTNEGELLSTLAQKWGRMLEHDYQVDLLAGAIMERVKELSGKKVRVDLVRKAINEGYKNADFNYKELPHWCNDVVYVDAEEEFFYMDNQLALGERGFNARNNRFLLTKKDRANMDAVPEQQAAPLALNVYQIPVVSGYVYLPGADRIVEWDGRKHVNRFNPDDIVPVPDKITSKARAAVNAVKRHFEVSYPVERERELLLSWLAYTIKRMDKKIRWAVVMQGVDGAGKGFIGEMLMAILSKNNVVTVAATSLEEKYTSFFESNKVVVIEEARIHGTSRYAVMDKLKPYITNDVVPIRRMHRDPYDVPSVTSTMILTNHSDALPVYDADRRYFVISTFLQTKQMIERFRAANPNHYDDIFNAIAYYPGAIREWLEDYPLHEEFDPDGHAPMTDAKARMIDMARSDDEDELEELIEESREPEVNHMLLNVGKLRDMAMDLNCGVPYGPKLSNFLTSKGFVYVGRARGANGKQARYWSKVPDKIVKPNLQAWIDDFLELATLKM